MVGVVARVVIKVKIDITNGFGIWLFPLMGLLSYKIV
jgi:hypothetical protein